MVRWWREARGEIGPLIALALPLVLGEFGWMTMSVVDSAMVGRLSKEAMGAVSLGGVLFYTVTVFGTGTMLGLDTVVSQAFGAGKLKSCHQALVDGIWIAAALAPLLMLIQAALGYLLTPIGIHPAVVTETRPYLSALLWSTPWLLVYTALRRYLQAMNHASVIMFSLISANLVNAAANWILIFGHFGFPAMGTAGAGWATTISRIYMAATLIVFAFWMNRTTAAGLREARWLPSREGVRELLQLGAPAAFQIAVELAVFAIATALIGRLDPANLAAHQIAMNAASFSYMVPVGLGSAAAVRVGQAVGRRDWHSARASGWIAIALGVAIMGAFGILYVGAPHFLGHILTSDPSVVQAAVPLLALVALFQLFDGAQGVATGALRGAGNTRIPAISHLVGYWLFGLPLGYILCFHFGWGAAGLWSGLCLALISIGIVLAIAWAAKTRQWRNLES